MQETNAVVNEVVLCEAQLCRLALAPPLHSAQDSLPPAAVQEMVQIYPWPYL